MLDDEAEGFLAQGRAGHAEHLGQRRQDREEAGGKPLGCQSHRAHNGGRSPEAHQDAGQFGGVGRVRHRKKKRCHRTEERSGDEHGPCAEARHQDSRRDLQQDVGIVEAGGKSAESRFVQRKIDDQTFSHDTGEGLQHHLEENEQRSGAENQAAAPRRPVELGSDARCPVHLAGHVSTVGVLVWAGHRSCRASLGGRQGGLQDCRTVALTGFGAPLEPL